MIEKKASRILALLLTAALAASFFVIPPVSTAAEDSVTVISFGDSFSSGEGIPPFYKQNYTVDLRVKEQDWLAHRSEKSWPGRLKFDGLSGTLAEHKDTNWYFVATSGAETHHLDDRFPKEYRKQTGTNMLGEPEYISDTGYIDPQLKIFEKVNGGTVDYITMTLGGNDAKFVDVIMQAAIDSYINLGFLSSKLNEVWQSFYADGGIRDNLYVSYKKIAAAAPNAKIIVAGYPKLLEPNGKGLFSKDAAALVNDSITRFNDEIETVVKRCKAEGMKICFVDVEEKFEGHAAYSDEPYLNEVYFGTREQDLKDFYVRDIFSTVTSAYSMHPNDDGAAAYAACVQEKIDSIEADGGKTEWPDMHGSDECDIVLSLDASGSMDGTPINKTVEASEKFIESIFEQDASIGVVSYDDEAMVISPFCTNQGYLNNTIQNINAGGGTNIEDGLRKAYEMLLTSTAKRKIILLMSDGQPNEGKTGDALVAYADTIKQSGVYIYTLGFFDNVANKSAAQDLMEHIASDGCHHEIDDVDAIAFTFQDIADQIQGVKYIYIRIKGAADVTVTYKGQELTSKEQTSNQRTDFGTLTFEEDPESDGYGGSSDDRIKTVRLKDGEEYDVVIESNSETETEIDYTIGFMDGDGVYSDMRQFTDIPVGPNTRIETVAKPSKSTVLNVDSDGDGIFDLIYKAAANAIGKLSDKSSKITVYVIIAIVALAAIGGGALFISKKRKAAKGSADMHSSPSANLPVQGGATQSAAPRAESAPVQSAAPRAPIPAPRQAAKPTGASVSAQTASNAPAPESTASASVEKAEYNFCSNCGTRKRVTDTFCPNCGTRS